MKKRLIAFAVLAVLACGAFAQESSPLAGFYNGDSSPGEKDYWATDIFREQDGYALVQGRTLHYWLYNTVAGNDGDASDICGFFVPRWVEGMGYVIDYDNIRAIRPNNNLATSVRKLMLQRKSDVSAALVTDADFHYVVINECFEINNDYKTTIYPLYKR